MSSLPEKKNDQLTAAWQSPSNIALIKYWGKHGRQLPRNASISFTLSEARTQTSVQLTHTSNTFPHSSGIASSASGMSALALCLCELDAKLRNAETDHESFLKRASLISRLGSGSACRSTYALLALWGTHESVPSSSDMYAIGLGDELHPVFRNYHDDILIVSDREKSVSSSAGHQLMENNVYASARYNQAQERLTAMLQALREGNLQAFVKMTEEEALTLHALMMCSSPSYTLMTPETLNVIQHIQNYRRETGIPVCFTLDAGPNVHILYPNEVAPQVSSLIQDHLLPMCSGARIIRDKVGSGPCPVAR